MMISNSRLKKPNWNTMVKWERSFLDVALILHRDGSVETNFFYKTTNSHDYLSFDSHHPKQTKENVPYNLAKKIVVFSRITKERNSDLVN